jgi:hypothetical protein
MFAMIPFSSVNILLQDFRYSFDLNEWCITASGGFFQAA